MAFCTGMSCRELKGNLTKTTESLLNIKVIIIRNGIGDPSSNSGWGSFHLMLIMPLAKV